MYFLFCLAFIGWGLYRIAGPGDLTLLQRVWSTGMIVMGSVLLLCGLFLRFTKTEAQAADEIDELDRKMYVEPHELALVGEDVIRAYGGDLAFYQTRTAELSALGFRHVGDYVDVTAEQAAKWMRAVIRASLGDGGATMTAVFDVRVRGMPRLLQLVGLVPRTMLCVEFETEFTDGTFACTTDAVEAAKTLEFPGISRVFLTPGTPTAQMLAAHHEHLQRRMAASPGIEPLRFTTFAELAASQDRMQQLKGRFRMSPEYDPAREMEKISGQPLSDAEQRVANDIAARRGRYQ